MGYKDRYGKRPMPPPRSLANLKREISEKKWEEAWIWSKNRVRGKKYQMPNTMHQNSMVAQTSKRLAGRFHQLKTGHCCTGQYLKWTKNSDTAECGWCRYKSQTREHLFKNCDKWKMQQKILWAEVRKKTGRGKDRFRMRDLFADERCTGAILAFLRTTEVGTRVGRKGCRRNQRRWKRRQRDSGGSEPGSEDDSHPFLLFRSYFTMSFLCLSLSHSHSFCHCFLFLGMCLAGAWGVTAGCRRVFRDRGGR